MFLDFLNTIYRTEDDGANPTAGASDDDTQDDGGNWLEALPEDVRTRVEEYAQTQADKLKAALEAERKAHKDTRKQIKELASKPVEASQYEAQIKELGIKAAEAEARATFTESAAEQGVSAVKIGKLFKIAKIDDLIDETGAADWAALKSEYPEFFPAVEEKPKPRANAGTGRGATPVKQESTRERMNSLIRNRGR